MTVAIDNVLYVVTFTWRVRTASWYLDLALQDGTQLASGRRLTPSWGPLIGLLIEGAPDGMLITSGPEEFDQADLGDKLRLMFFPTDELTVTDDDDDEPQIVKVV
jgi:hypothetical protein